ncbi:MAG TPA: hypothetical protein VNS55_12910 [Nocardioides sp.]|nr:hypothetical protein [Nocardioides sp.]
MTTLTDLGPQCHVCHRHRTLRRVDHPSGIIVLCTHCGSIHAKSAAPQADDHPPVLVLVQRDEVKAAG